MVRKGPKVGGGGMNGDRVAIGGVSRESSVIMGNTNSPPRTERKGEETEGGNGVSGHGKDLFL